MAHGSLRVDCYSASTPAKTPRFSYEQKTPPVNQKGGEGMGIELQTNGSRAKRGAKKRMHGERLSHRNVVDHEVVARDPLRVDNSLEPAAVRVRQGGDTVHQNLE